MIKFDCGCGQKLGVADKHAGKRVRYTRCGEVVPVPAAAPVLGAVALAATPPALPVNDAAPMLDAIDAMWAFLALGTAFKIGVGGMGKD